ncbi:unnamed protein product [Parnassius mnemosyne]|uniref:Uncharacterized protein n=1 Tax=Parnassius mnemosyne TaxID=213953 RepID=A0AAV1KHR9_9NEOP
MAWVYSCCFWFSLRLGGILIGIFSAIQGIILLIVCGVGCSEPEKIKQKIAVWINDVNLIYTKDYVETLQTDPKKALGIIIVLTCIYIIICLLYVYGAYKCNNVLMVVYILVELVRLIALTTFVTTMLLMLKQNTMDIGLLIAVSVVGGFVLLGMFYMWVCAANLPIVINEKKHDEQAATIAKLHQLLNANKAKTTGLDDTSRLVNNEYSYHNNVFVVSNKNIPGVKDMRQTVRGFRISVPYYSSGFNN